MHTGKISEIAYKRSVLRKITDKADGLTVGVDAAEIDLEDVTLVMSSNCILKYFDGCEKYHLQKCINDIYALGGVPGNIKLDINIPNVFEEKALGRIMKRFDDECVKRRLKVSSCNVYSGIVTEPVIHVTLLGKSKNQFRINDIKENMCVVMAGTVAMGATAILSKKYESQVEKRFNKTFVKDCLLISEFLDTKDITETGLEQSVVYMHHVSDGGVFGAIWELASGTNMGIDVDMKKIPVWQEEIELAEMLDYNPYLVDGTGAVLMVTDAGESLVQTLQDKGIYAQIIGHMTKGRDRVVRNGDETRFLEPPKGDEIYRYL
jgi:hydrogenase maturation factor